MNEEEKKAIEYLKTRLYGNEGCKYIDVAQEDLRIFINLVDRKEKDIEGWKKYCEEIEEERIEMSNKNCELEFEVEKLQKENEILKEEKEQAWEEWNNLEQGSCETEQKLKQQIKKLQKENEEVRVSNKKLYEIGQEMYKQDKYTSENYISKQTIKDKIEELNNISNAEKLEDIMIGGNYTITELVQYVLQELIEERSDIYENM